VTSALRVDFSRSTIARYIQLASLFRRRIESGQWPVGQQIPTIDELSEECGVARATVRQALDVLSEECLIERFRAKGTFVIAKEQDLWCDIRTDWSGLLSPSADDTRIELMSHTTRGIELPISHGIGEVAPAYLHARRRHSRQGRPFLVTDLYIDYDLKKSVNRRDLTSKTALRLISDLLGSEIADAQHTMTIGTADVVLAEALQLSVNAPVAYVRREVVDKQGRLVLVSDGIYRGDVIRLSVKLR